MSRTTEYFKAKQLVDQLRRLTQTQASADEYVPLLNRMLHFLPVTAVPLQNPVLYRARLNETPTLFETVRELGYPPSQYVAAKGRLNECNESILYAALCELGCIVESKPDIGQLFTLATIERPDTNPVLFFPIGVRGRDFSFKAETKTHRLFIDWLHDELSKVVESTEGYNSTIAIAKFFMHKEIVGYPGEKFGGIVYPSVPGKKTSNTTTFNVAMQPGGFDRHFRISSAQVYCLTSEPDCYCLQSLNTGEIQQNGSIVWRLTYEEMINRALRGINVEGSFSPHLSCALQSQGLLHAQKPTPHSTGCLAAPANSNVEVVQKPLPMEIRL